MRILFGTKEIAGYQRGLVTALKDLGVPCLRLELEPHAFSYDMPTELTFYIKPFVAGVRRFCVFRKKIMRKNGLAWALPRFLVCFVEALLRLPVFVWAAFSFDVFVFSYASNFMGYFCGYHDLCLLKLLKKKVGFVFHGSDSRPPFMDGAHQAYAKTQPGDFIHNLKKLSDKQFHKIKKTDHLADFIIDNPTTAQFHNRAFFDFVKLGIPYDFSASQSVAVQIKNFVILHAPSNSLCKGTERILKSIAVLKQKHPHIELRLLQNKSHKEVLKELAHCNLVVDQLYADFALPGLACEAAHFAKPVIICGHHDPATVQPNGVSCYVSPEELEAALEDFILHPEKAKDLGQRVQEFVQNEWTSQLVAKRFLKIIKGSCSELLVEPGSLHYIWGWG
ncbi:MAG: glycosyltransferase, partial [Deltaproteobacteria bacterium]|nr:glycosyltransferase [Deltaproteobacteria bacterium]